MNKINFIMKNTVLTICTCVILTSQLFSQTVVADKQYESHMYLDALQSYLATGHGNNYSEHVCIQVARCYDKLGLSENSNDWYEKAASLFETSDEYALEAGKVKMRTGDYIGARMLFEKYNSIDTQLSSHYIHMVENSSNILDNGIMHNQSESIVNNKPTNEFAPFLLNDKLYFTTPLINVELDSDASKKNNTN